MIECPSITFSGVGAQCSRLGAPHLHLTSAGSSVYITTCTLFKSIFCLFCTLIYSVRLPMVSSILFLYENKNIPSIKSALLNVSLFNSLKMKVVGLLFVMLTALFSVSQR